HIVDIVAVNRHFATGDIVEARYQANQGGFSCAGLADKSDGLSRFDGEVDVAQHKVGLCVVSVIGKVHVIQDNAPDYRWERLGYADTCQLLFQFRGDDADNGASLPEGDT